jgi:hypothetical protein
MEFDLCIMSSLLISFLNFLWSSVRQEISVKKTPLNSAFQIVYDNGNIIPHLRQMKFPRALKCCWYYFQLSSLQETPYSSVSQPPGHGPVPGSRLIQIEITGPRSDKGGEPLSYSSGCEVFRWVLLHHYYLEVRTCSLIFHTFTKVFIHSPLFSVIILTL